ncbi:hypothetical protein N0V84_008563 [Fusarium piperis]|uniref:Uncharacterized protein n=1 Tax=Fusarium piperis TaxID=1435070 RepID=A0A9W8W7Y0_9HYPO|nr:hypothetical protein N0V84_008563 [Fusarium piperis]
MTDKGLGQEVDQLYATIDIFITDYNALKKKWDAASNLALLPLEEAFQENCNLAAFVGTKDPEANDATYAEERKAVSAVLLRGGNPYEELFKLFQKHAGAVAKAFSSCKEISHKALVAIGECESQSGGQEGKMLAHLKSINELLQKLHKGEADQEKQLAEYLSKAGGNDQSYELAQKHAASAAQEVESCEVRIKSLKEKKKNLKDKLDPDVGLPDFYDGWDDEYAGAAEAGWGTGVNLQISRVDGDISSEQAKLPNLRTTASNLQKQVGDIEKEKGIREKAIATLKASDAHLTAILGRLQDISNKSGPLRTKLQGYVTVFTECESHVGYVLNKAELFQVKDVVKFDTKTRARLGNKVVAVVNQGAYFADRPRVLLLLRQTLAVVRKANDLTGSSEGQVRLLKDNADLVSKLLDQSQAAISAGKHEIDLPQPAKLLEAE